MTEEIKESQSESEDELKQITILEESTDYQCVCYSFKGCPHKTQPNCWECIGECADPKILQYLSESAINPTKAINTNPPIGVKKRIINSNNKTNSTPIDMIILRCQDDNLRQYFENNIKFYVIFYDCLVPFIQLLHLLLKTYGQSEPFTIQCGELKTFGDEQLLRNGIKLIQYFKDLKEYFKWSIPLIDIKPVKKIQLPKLTTFNELGINNFIFYKKKKNCAILRNNNNNNK